MRLAVADFHFLDACIITCQSTPEYACKCLPPVLLKLTIVALLILLALPVVIMGTSTEREQARRDPARTSCPCLFECRPHHASFKWADP